MLTIRRILFPTDFSEAAEHAFSIAAELADRFDAEVVVFHARVGPGEANDPLAFYPKAEGQARKPAFTLDDPLYKEIDVRDGERVRVVQAEIVGTSPEEAIVAFAQKYDIDLIVMGTHGRHGAARLLRHSTAEHVLRLAPCPVLTIRQEAMTLFSKDPIEMLVPVDFSDYSREAIRWAVALSRVFPSRVTLLHMVEEAVFPTVYGVEAAPISTVNLVLDRSKAMLDELGQEFFPADAQPAKDVRIGHAAGGITAFAEENATDLIVLATHGLTGLKRFLMGSVAERVVRFAPCAVFATKAAQKSAGVASNANIVSEHVPAEEGRNAMNAYPRILHPADFSETSDAAFAFAVDLARRHGSELHLLHVAPNFGGDPMHTAYAETLDKKRFYQRMQEEAEARMKAMIAANDAESVRIKRVHTHGHSPAPSILAYAGDQRIDLIVIGTHGRRGLRRFVLGSVAEEVIRGATCDVLAVQDRSRPLVPRRLLVPVDLSASSPSHLEGAARIAARFGAEMDVLHVLPEAPLPAWGVDPDILHEVIAKRRDEAEEELAKLIEPIVKSGTVVRTAIDVGSAGSAIVEAARRLDADLIVMAPYARRIVERFFLGSVTEWVIRHADRPLYITHASVPDDKRSPAFASAQAES